MLQAGDNLKFSIQYVDENGKEHAMQGRHYHIRLPISLSAVSPLTLGQRPVFTYYPFFFSKGGKP